MLFLLMRITRTRSHIPLWTVGWAASQLLLNKRCIFCKPISPYGLRGRCEKGSQQRRLENILIRVVFRRQLYLWRPRRTASLLPLRLDRNPSIICTCMSYVRSWGSGAYPEGYGRTAGSNPGWGANLKIIHTSFSFFIWGGNRGGQVAYSRSDHDSQVAVIFTLLHIGN